MNEFAITSKETPMADKPAPLSSEQQKAALGNVRRKPLQKDMFTGNYVRAKPKAGHGDHIVLKADETEPVKVPGMAYFAGTGPAGKRCFECDHCRDLPMYGRKRAMTKLAAGVNEDAQPRRIEENACRKAAELYGDVVQIGGIQFNQACKYFEPRS